MDKLKEILANKPKAKIVSHKQTIAKERQAYLAQLQKNKKQKQENQAKRLKEVQSFYSQGRKRKNIQAQTQPPLSVQQVKSKLRELYQPVTLFGQTPNRRYQRYLKAKQFHELNPNEDMKLYDEQFAKKIKQSYQFDDLDAKYRQSMVEPRLLDNTGLREKKLKMIIQEKGQRAFGEKCDEIFLWIKKTLNQWGQVLQRKNYDKKHLEDIKRKYDVYEQTKSQLSSFQRVLKAHTGDKEMIGAIYNIMNCCLVREYVQANNKYLQLSVGTAPWPLGQAMLSIIVRNNVSKLSHVLDQQMTRRWMQGLKRLMSASQQLYPNEDSMKMTRLSCNQWI